MLQREIIIREWWKRLADVDGVVYTARNPKSPPGEENLPAIQFFEMGDVVVKRDTRGGREYPIYIRRLTVITEIFILGDTEQSSSAELMVMVGNVKKTIYADGDTLGRGSGRLCEVQEIDGSRILRPATGGAVVGIGLAHELLYIEDTSKLFE